MIAARSVSLPTAEPSFTLWGNASLANVDVSAWNCDCGHILSAYDNLMVSALSFAGDYR